MTAEIVSAYVGNNTVRTAELPDLIQAVHASLTDIVEPKPAEEPAPELKPAVPVKKSVTDEFIISLEDGRKFKSMKRYLAQRGMTPENYRAKWGLPHDYPMVAPSYAAKRSELAKAAGLGSSRRNGAAGPDLMASTALTAPTGAAPTVVPDEAEKASESAADAPAKRRGRPKKAA